MAGQYVLLVRNPHRRMCNVLLTSRCLQRLPRIRISDKSTPSKLAHWQILCLLRDCLGYCTVLFRCGRKFWRSCRNSLPPWPLRVGSHTGLCFDHLSVVHEAGARTTYWALVLLQRLGSDSGWLTGIRYCQGDRHPRIFDRTLENYFPGHWTVNGYYWHNLFVRGSR